MTSPAPQPRHLILLIAALQCLYVLDFMLPLPLGPDLAAALGFEPSLVAWLTAAYTASALLAGLAGMACLDHFDRRRALLLSLGGLSLALLACAAARDLGSLLLARAAVGLFAAPANASTMAILIDNTAPAQRGSAIAKVMSGFALATVAGIPLSLELSTRLSWQACFLSTAGLALLLALASANLLPAQTRHLSTQEPPDPLRLLKRKSVQAAAALQGINQFAAFLVIPNFAAFYLLNLNYPRSQLGLLYLAGGVLALGCVQLAGRACDRFGPRPAITLASVAFIIGLTPFLGLSFVPATLCFMLFMAGNAARNLSLATTLSQIPAPQERAGFMALMALIQNLGMALASAFAAIILGSEHGGALTHTSELACLTILGTLVIPWWLIRLQRMHANETPKPAARAA